MKTSKLITAALALCVAFTAFASAPEMPKATKHEDPKFYRALYLKFKPGKIEEGRKIIGEYFEVAGANAKNGAIAFNYQTGEWHHVVFFPLAKPGDIEWKIAPIDERWWGELAKLVGGPAKARELMTKFEDMVIAQKFELVLRSI